jgi:amicyanin
MTPASLTSPASGATSAARDATAVGDAVTIKDFSYHPAELRVPVGTQVTWTNLDTVAHSVTGSGFDSGLLSQGQSWSHVFAAAGTYDYHCQPHPYMTGTVIVG